MRDDLPLIAGKHSVAINDLQLAVKELAALVERLAMISVKGGERKVMLDSIDLIRELMDPEDPS